MKRILQTGIVSGALALSLACGAGNATAAPRSPDHGALTLYDKGGPRDNNQQGKGKGAELALLVKTTSDVTGLKNGAIVKELRAGKSLAQIAQEHGKAADDVIRAARATLKARLDQAVASGKQTQARADQALAAFDASAPQLMQQASAPKPGQQRAAKEQAKRVRAALIQATAAVTGLTPGQVRQELRAGKSLAQIAQEHGKTADDILAKLREQAGAKIDSIVEQARTIVNQAGAGDDAP
jgi:hypothetical protein